MSCGFVKTSIFATVFLEQDQQRTWTGSQGNMWSRPSNVWNVLFSKWIFDNMTLDIGGLHVYGIFWVQTRELNKSGFWFVTNPKNWLKGGLRFVPSRVEIFRDRHDRRSCKIFANCVNFPGKQRNFLHHLRRSTRFTYTKCDLALKLLKLYNLS